MPEDTQIVHTSELSDAAHFVLLMAQAIEPGIPLPVVEQTYDSGALCPTCRKTNLRANALNATAICPGCLKAQKLTDFCFAFKENFGRDFKDCPKRVWSPLFDQGLKELAAFKIIDVTRDGMGGWRIIKIHYDRIDAGHRVISKVTH